MKLYSVDHWTGILLVEIKIWWLNQDIVCSLQ